MILCNTYCVTILLSSSIAPIAAASRLSEGCSNAMTSDGATTLTFICCDATSSARMVTSMTARQCLRCSYDLSTPSNLAPQHEHVKPPSLPVRRYVRMYRQRHISAYEKHAYPMHKSRYNTTLQAAVMLFKLLQSSKWSTRDESEAPHRIINCHQLHPLAKDTQLTTE
jgi:hypothetical protein